MSACLLVNSTIILSLMVVKSLELVFILFSKIVLFFCIHIDPLYRYYFPVFIPIPCIGIVFF